MIFYTYKLCYCICRINVKGLLKSKKRENGKTILPFQHWCVQNIIFNGLCFFWRGRAFFLGGGGGGRFMGRGVNLSSVSNQFDMTRNTNNSWFHLFRTPSK